jgi:hypothetical protein
MAHDRIATNWAPMIDSEREWESPTRIPIDNEYQPK